jgi:hypothetical protein
MARYGRRSRDGRGLAHCDLTGAVCDATDRRWVNGVGWVRTRDADPDHPLDYPHHLRLDDPRPVPNARPRPVIEPSKQDLGLADDDVLEALQR